MKKFLSALLCVVIIFSLPFTAFADIGPKPSVHITFNGIKDSTIYENGTVYYATLLSEQKSTGPSSAWDGIAGHEEYDGFDREIWQAFADYTDKDGYYFLQEIWECTETHQLDWTYYPPGKFKILIYFPQTDIYFMSDDIYERYAFDSYYTVEIISDMYAGQTVKAEKSYNYTWEIISLAARIAATILIEILIAFLFFYREKSALKFIAAVNVFTQIVLNVGLNIVNYSKGSMAFVFYFIIFEVVVFALEAVIYTWFIKNFTKKTNTAKSTAYAFAANLASFAIGLWISHIVPGIF